MKVTIAHLPGEEREAASIQQFICDLCTPVKVRKSDRHPPFKHVYLTTKKPENPCNSSKND